MYFQSIVLCLKKKVFCLNKSNTCCLTAEACTGAGPSSLERPYYIVNLRINVHEKFFNL